MNKKIALGALAFAIMLPASIAFAEEISQTTPSTTQPAVRPQIRAEIQAEREQNKELREAKRLEFQDKKEKIEQARCKNIEAKIATQFKRYENNGKMLRNVYGNMQTRLTRLVEKLDETKADTVQLKANLVTLDEKIGKLYADHSKLLITLQASQTFVCEGTEGEFKGRLENARKIPALIRQDRQDIKNFFQTTIKTDLQAIRTSLAEEKEEIEEPKAVKESKKSAPTPEVTPVEPVEPITVQ